MGNEVLLNVLPQPRYLDMVCVASLLHSNAVQTHTHITPRHTCGGASTYPKHKVAAAAPCLVAIRKYFGRDECVCVWKCECVGEFSGTSAGKAAWRARAQ